MSCCSWMICKRRANCHCWYEMKTRNELFSEKEFYHWNESSFMKELKPRNELPSEMELEYMIEFVFREWAVMLEWSIAKDRIGLSEWIVFERELKPWNEFVYRDRTVRREWIIALDRAVLGEWIALWEGTVLYDWICVCRLNWNIGMNCRIG